jgi:hypothetical protein
MKEEDVQGVQWMPKAEEVAMGVAKVFRFCLQGVCR